MSGQRIRISVVGATPEERLAGEVFLRTHRFLSGRDEHSLAGTTEEDLALLQAFTRRYREWQRQRMGLAKSISDELPLFEATAKVVKTEVAPELKRALHKLSHPFRGESQRGLAPPPLHFVMTVVSFFCSKKTRERVLVEIVADVREEYFEAVAANEVWKARWIVVRGYWSVGSAIGLKRWFAFLGKLVGQFVR